MTWFNRADWSWFAAATLAAGLCGTAASLVADPRLLAPLARYRDDFDAGLARMLLPPRGRTLVRAQVCACTVLMAVAWLLTEPMYLGLGPPLFAAPRIWLKHALDRRRTAIEEQLDGWLMALVSALRAAPALGEALASTRPLVHGALRAELQVVLRAFQLGTPLDESLITMARRVGSPPLAAALTTLRVARRTGGELSATLEKSANALREMARLEGVVRSQTASGRAQALTISLLPVPLVLLLNWLNPDYLQPLFTTALGNALAAIALLLWVVAGLWAKKIVEVDL